jgi:hypothetical protein
MPGTVPAFALATPAHVPSDTALRQGLGIAALPRSDFLIPRQRVNVPSIRKALQVRTHHGQAWVVVGLQLSGRLFARFHRRTLITEYAAEERDRISPISQHPGEHGPLLFGDLNRLAVCHVILPRLPACPAAPPNNAHATWCRRAPRRLPIADGSREAACLPQPPAFRTGRSRPA